MRNHHLNHPVEFIFVNVGGLWQNAKVGDPPKTVAGVGGVIVV